MAGNLTDAAENGILDHLTARTTYTVTSPLKVRLMTANGSDSTAGTELGTSGGYTAGGATIAFDAAAAGTTQNTSAVTWTNMPAATIVGLEIWDSSGSPKRLWSAPLTSSKTLASGDTFYFGVGDVVITID